MQINENISTIMNSSFFNAAANISQPRKLAGIKLISWKAELKGNKFIRLLFN